MSALSDTLAAHAAGAAARGLPNAAAEAACRSVIDAWAVMSAASGLGEGIDAFAAITHETAPAGPATILGFGQTSSPAMAAWVNGAMAHALDYEDTHDHAIAHPHAAAVPAALAMAEARGDVDGRLFLAAIAISGDLVCRIASSFEVNPDSFGWHTTPWLGVFGAATAAGVVLRLSPDQMKSAWSLAASQMGSFGAVRHSRGSHLRAVRDAFAAKAGVLGAELAARGVAGFDQPLEGEGGFLDAVARGRWQAAPMLDALGMRWMGAEVSLKPWPACRGTHAPIAAALALREEIAGAEIKSITVTVSEKNRMLCEPLGAKQRPETAIGAKFSVPFCVAAALAHGNPSLATFSRAGLADPRTLELAARVQCRVDPAIAVRDTGVCTVEVTAGGKTFRRETRHAPGHPSQPMTDEALRLKFDTCLAAARVPVTGAAADALWCALSGIGTAPDLAALRQAAL